jgi:hypothetical protein
MMMKTFQVTMSRMDNPDKLKFIEVAECMNMDECIDYIHSTEKEFIINAIRQTK